MCLGAAALPVRKVMHPIGEHIQIDASIRDVIDKMVAWQTLSVLVTEKDRPVGLVRLADLCDAVIAEMSRPVSGKGSEG
jgi:CBS domain-containing protein